MSCDVDENTGGAALLSAKLQTGLMHASDTIRPGGSIAWAAARRPRGIVDRVSNNAYRIRLTGDVNTREATSKVKRWGRP